MSNQDNSNISLSKDNEDEKYPNNVIIDNVVVSKFGNGVKITPINLFRLANIKLTGVRKISFGTRLLDNNLLSQLSDGNLKYEDIFNGEGLTYVD